MLSSIKPLIERNIQPIIKPFSKINPHVLSVIGIIPPIIFYICLVNQLYLASIIAFLGVVFDLIDGSVARLAKKESNFGAVLDSTLDRISDFILIASFAFAKIVNWEITLFFILCSFIISYIRSRAELASLGKIKLTVGIMERTERLIGIFLSLLFFILFPNKHILNLNLAEIGFLILIIFSFITVVQRLIFSYKNLK